jgi:hypothetical protein
MSLPLEHPVLYQLDEVLFSESLRPKLDQELAQVSQSVASRLLQLIDLLEDSCTAMLLVSERLKVEKHGGKRLGHAVMQLAGENVPHLLDRRLGASIGKLGAGARFSDTFAR